MLTFNDPRWNTFKGGYRVLYDPRKALLTLEFGKDVEAAWDELWERLHHQGDVDEASYAAVPHLLRVHIARKVPNWHTYAIVTVIEIARRSGGNPEIPSYLRESYDAAWRQLVEVGLSELKMAEDPALISSIIAVLAIGKGEFYLGQFAFENVESERHEILTKWYLSAAER